MNYLQLLLSFIAGCNFLTGIVFSYTAIRIDSAERRLYFYFSIVCFSLAALLGIDAQLYYTPTVEGSTIVLAKLAITSSIIFHLFLTWFVAEYTNVKPRAFLTFISLSFVLILVVNPFFPVTLIDKAVYGMNAVKTSWGEVIYFPELETSIWAIPVLGILLLMFIYFIVASILQFKRGQVRDAVSLGIPLVICMIASMRDLLIDIVKQPDIFVTELFFFSIVLVMGLRLSLKVVEAVQIEKELIKNERRWRTLLENVELLVLGMDTQGIVNYVNPYYLKLTGFSEQEVLGKSLTNVVPKTGKDLPSESLTSPEEEYIQPHYQNTILTKAGQKRIITWSTVGLYNRENLYVGTLSIGADVTEREKAFQEIKQLKDRLLEENIYLQEEIILDHNYRDIIGRSDTLKYALSRVTQVAPTDTTVLLEGETGVGKELFARAVHQGSSRNQRPLVRVNCAAIPVNLIESELFGHVKGAFTGADKDRKGRFELADKGTIFLDEISELPLEVQSKLLRVLEEGDFERLGSNQMIRVDVRIIAATNRDLKKEVQKETFREDLFYRLHAYPISIPPLRKRRDDILPLVEFFVDKFSRKMGKRIEKIPKNIQEMLLSYDWPGNVRELRNVIERAVIATPGNKMVLPETLHSPEPVGFSEEEEIEIIPLEEVERRHIIQALEATGGKISGENGAAALLRIHPNTLRFRMQKLGIKKAVS